MLLPTGHPNGHAAKTDDPNRSSAISSPAAWSMLAQAIATVRWQVTVPVSSHFTAVAAGRRVDLATLAHPMPGQARLLVERGDGHEALVALAQHHGDRLGVGAIIPGTERPLPVGVTSWAAMRHRCRPVQSAPRTHPCASLRASIATIVKGATGPVTDQTARDADPVGAAGGRGHPSRTRKARSSSNPHECS